jgi:UDP-N-acetylmuramate--alanine ligase
MSALARFFCQRGAVVSGYDRTETPLTKKLVAEGMDVHYTDDVNLCDRNAQLVVYTPAIPAHHAELNWYRDNGYAVYKRSDVLQWITEAMYSVTVGGTHGKTTISTTIAWLLRETGYGCNAFLGGISVNYESNYWHSNNNTAVIEADEYDRSFLKLRPDIAVLTAIDPDHLDIYGTPAEMEEAFIQYTRNIKPGGTLLVKQGLHRQNELLGPNTVTYSLTDETATVHAANVNTSNGGYTFDVIGPGWTAGNMRLNIGGLHNVENAVAAIAVTQMLGINIDAVRNALAAFRGIRRRFEYLVNKDTCVYIDDYAHHPEELSALIRSAKGLFPGRRCVVAFQPHLFSRTRDLAEGFAHSLDMADKVILLDIYPARELPMPGITSATISALMKNPNVTHMTKDALVAWVATHKPSLMITAGAGDIDKLTEPIKNTLNEN